MNELIIRNLYVRNFWPFVITICITNALRRCRRYRRFPLLFEDIFIFCYWWIISSNYLYIEPWTVCLMEDRLSWIMPNSVFLFSSQQLSMQILHLVFLYGIQLTSGLFNEVIKRYRIYVFCSHFFSYTMLHNTFIIYCRWLMLYQVIKDAIK